MSSFKTNLLQLKSTLELNVGSLDYENSTDLWETEEDMH